MKATNTDLNFDLLQRALLKIHPNYSYFLQEFLEKLRPIILQQQSTQEAHFIHLVGFIKMEKAREIITDVLEMLQWQNESVFIWEGSDEVFPCLMDQAMALQENYSKFPKILVTNGFYDFFHEVQFDNIELCDFGRQLTRFMQERKELDLSGARVNSIQGGGTLIISFIPNFNSRPFYHRGGLLKFLWENPTNDIQILRREYFPDELRKLVEKNYLRRNEFIFFSKDESKHIQTVLDLISICPTIEACGGQILEIPVKLTFEALAYFYDYTFYKRLNFTKQKQEALAFFDPIFRQYSRFGSKIPEMSSPREITLDFKGGWRLIGNVD